MPLHEKLSQSPNKIVRALNDDCFYVNPLETQFCDTQLLKDVRRECIYFTGEQFHLYDIENPSSHDEENFDQYLHERFGEQKELLKKFYNQSLLSMPLLTAQLGYASDWQVISKRYYCNIHGEKDKIYADAYLLNLELAKLEALDKYDEKTVQRVYIPGMLCARYRLTEDGFLLEQFLGDTFQLDALIYRDNDVVIDASYIKQLRKKHEKNLAELACKADDNKPLQKWAAKLYQDFKKVAKNIPDDKLQACYALACALVDNPANEKNIDAFIRVTEQIPDCILQRIPFKIKQAKAKAILALGIIGLVLGTAAFFILPGMPIYWLIAGFGIAMACLGAALYFYKTDPVRNIKRDCHYFQIAAKRTLFAPKADKIKAKFDKIEHHILEAASMEEVASNHSNNGKGV